MACSRPAFLALRVCAVLCTALACALLVAALPGLGGRALSAAPPVFLPLIQPNEPPAPQPGPPASVRVAAPFLSLAAGQAVTLSATLHDAHGALVPPSADLNLFLSVGGRDLLADRIETTAGVMDYSARWTPPATGVYTVGAVAADTASGAKAGLPAAPVTFTVTPGPVVVLDLAAHTFAALALPDFLAVTLYDAAGNALPNPPPGSVTCSSDSPAVQPGAPAPLPTGFYANAYAIDLDGSRQLGVPLTAAAYGVSTITCTHAPSGATGSLPVAATPWEVRLSDMQGLPATTLNNVGRIAMRLDGRVPPGSAWTGLAAWFVYTRSLVLDQGGCAQLVYPASFSCGYQDSGGPTISFYAGVNSQSAHSGVTPAIKTEWFAINSVQGKNVDHAFSIADWELTSPGGEIPYEPAPLDPWRTITMTVVPTHSLPVHVYVVAGAANLAGVEADLGRVRRALAVHRAVCLPAYDLHAQVTEIPAGAWAALDADADGFDQWDGEGNGDFSGAADSDDFAAAAAAGYADPSSATISVYYVPHVRGAPALAGAGGGLALDGAQRDDWALYHLLAHALDLRADGVAGLFHAPAPPHNALNADAPGPFFTPEQCAALNP